MTEMEKNEGGVKQDAEKPRYDLLDPDAIHDLVLVLTFGAKKYSANNWRKGLAITRILAAAFRHSFAIFRGEDLDPETKLPHSAHLMCEAMFLNWMLKNRKDMDDRIIADKG